MVYTDGVVNQKGSGVGIVLVSPEKLILEKSLRFVFPATNYEAEYEVLLAGMVMVVRLGGKVLEVYSNSRLVVGQVNGEFKAREPRMQEYLDKVRHVQSCFNNFTLRQIPRGKNSHADSLAMLATSLGSNLPQVIIMEDLLAPSRDDQPPIRVHSIQVGPSWMDLLVSFLKDGTLPEDKGEAEKIRRKTSRYWLSVEQKLCKLSHSGPYLLCVHPEAVEPLLEELHEEICGSHTGGSLCCIELSPRDTGGLVCRKLPGSMYGNVINVKGTFQIYINLEES